VSYPLYSLAIAWPFMDQPQPVFSIILAALAVIVLGIAKSGFGGGVGVVAVPMMAIALGASESTAVLLPLLIAADVFSVLNHWRKWDPHLLRVLTPGSLIGIGIGSVVLWLLLVYLPAHMANGKDAKTVADNALNLTTGIVAVGYVLLDQVRAKYAPHWHFKPNFTNGTVVGFAVGVVSTISHAAGPIAAIFLLGQNLNRAAFIGTTVCYFFWVNTIKILPFALLGMFTPGALFTALLLLPLVPVGTWLGAKLSGRLSDHAFRTVIMVIVFITGLQLVLESITGIKLVSVVTSLVAPATQPR